MKWVLIVVGGIVALIAVMAVIGAFLPRDHRATSTISLRQPPDTVWKALQEIGSAGVRGSAENGDADRSESEAAVWRDVDL
jgi:hypothetical protein